MNDITIRCPICNLERKYEDIEYVLEGTDQVALVVGPCMITRGMITRGGGFFTIQQIPRENVPSYITGDKRIPLRVEARSYDNNILTNEEFQEWISNARENGTLKQFPTRSLSEVQSSLENIELSLPRSKTYRETLLARERITNYSGVSVSIILVLYSFVPGSIIPLLGKVLGAAMLVASLGTLLIDLRFR